MGAPDAEAGILRGAGGAEKLPRDQGISCSSAFRVSLRLSAGRLSGLGVRCCRGIPSARPSSPRDHGQCPPGCPSQHCLILPERLESQEPLIQVFLVMFEKWRWGAGMGGDGCTCTQLEAPRELPALPAGEETGTAPLCVQGQGPAHFRTPGGAHSFPAMSILWPHSRC